jgi:LPXTG-motif cell wall-anchored protein
VSNGVITVQVPTSDIGSPASNTLLEEVGSYSFGSAYQQSALTNNMAEADQLPLEVDGVCCFNFQANNLSAAVPETPWTPALLGLGVALMAVGGVVARRRRSRRPDTA